MNRTETQPSLPECKLPTAEILTKEQMAVIYQVTVRTIEKWTEDRLLPRIEMGTVTRYHWPTVLAYTLEHCSVPKLPGKPAALPLPFPQAKS